MGMAGGDHFMVHGFFFVTQVAAKAFFGALGKVARVVHSQRQGFLVGPVAFGVGAKPRGGGAVTIFAADAFAEIESARSLRRRDVQRVAGQTFRRRFRFLQSQNCGHTFAGRAGQRGIGLGMFVFDDPRAVFVLKNSILISRRYAAVASG